MWARNGTTTRHVPASATSALTKKKVRGRARPSAFHRSLTVWKGCHGVEGPENTSVRGSRARLASTFARPFAAVVVLIGASGALLAAGACLPELAPLGPDDASFQTSTAPFQGCGDGLIATLDDGGDSGESCDPGVDGAVPGCRSCQITCEGTLEPRTGHCYFAAGADTSYLAARTRCKAERAHVVTLASTNEAKLLERISADESGYWIGLSRDNELSGAYGPPQERLEEPGFAYPGAPDPAARGPCTGCFGIGADAGTFPLADVDASGTTIETSCVASRGGTWSRVPCSGSVTRPTICEREPVGVRGSACGNDGICFTVPQTSGEKTYLVSVSPADPVTADTTCRFLDGGSLVVFDSREEREQLAHEIVMRYPEGQSLWIGLHAEDGTWSWDDGLVATADGPRPLPWGNAQPTSTANGRALMHVGSTAYDRQLATAEDSGAQQLFICQRPAH